MKDLIEALQIFLKYGNPRSPTWCGDEVLYICGLDADDVSIEDKVRLDELGFFVDEEDNGFMSFRFGG